MEPKQPRVLGPLQLGYAAVETVGMSTFIAGNNDAIYVTDPIAIFILLVCGLVAYELYRIFNP